MYIWDDKEIVDILIHYPTTSRPQSNLEDIELVRIFKEYKQLQTENKTMARLLLEVSKTLQNCPSGYPEQMKIIAEQALKGDD